MPPYIWPASAWGFSFASGCATWYTIDALRTLQTAALCLNVLYLDDVYLSGFLRSRLGIELFPTAQVAHDLKHNVERKELKNFQIVCHQSPTELRAFWDEFAISVLPNTNSVNNYKQVRTTAIPKSILSVKKLELSRNDKGPKFQQLQAGSVANLKSQSSQTTIKPKPLKVDKVPQSESASAGKDSKFQQSKTAPATNVKPQSSQTGPVIKNEPVKTKSVLAGKDSKSKPSKTDPASKLSQAGSFGPIRVYKY